MSDTTSLIQLLRTIPAISHVNSAPDKVNSISSAVVRCVFEGERAVVVAHSTKAQIGGLLDLVDLHMHGDGRVDEHPIRLDRVTCLVLEDAEDSEAIDALRTLVGCFSGAFGVRLLRMSSDGIVHPVSVGTPDLGDAEAFHYTGWAGLLNGIDDGPPELVREVMTAAARKELRAYPMLSSPGLWSLRVEGLEVGRVGHSSGSLTVGKDRDRLPGAKRRAWVAVAGSKPFPVNSVTSQNAGRLIGEFASAFLASGGQSHRKPKQDEHALESRVLRGAVPLWLDGNIPLHVLTGTPDGFVNWGSQFPTRWGHTTSNSARYLDALMRTGRTPWAVEIKVDGGAGTGQYYRHAVSQAVLYREFIRRAVSLSGWFERHGLDQDACRAAVVVPESTRQDDKLTRLAAVCAAFDVDLVLVPAAAAGLAEYLPEQDLLTGLPQLFAAIGCTDVEELSDAVNEECEPDMWAAEIEGGVEVGSGTGAVGLEFPFSAADFWLLVREVEQLEMERLGRGTP